MSAIVPLSRLEAVNEMLFDIGERPVNSLSGSTRLDVTRAIATLDRVQRNVLTRGWWFNTELIELTVDGSGYYNLPTNVVHAEVYDGGPTQGPQDRTPFLVVRDSKLYDTENQTDVFIGAAEVTLRIVRLLEYEVLPSSVRDYVYAAASIRNQSRAFGSKQVDAELRDQAASALATMHEENLDALDLDQTTSDHFITLMWNR